MQCDRLCLHMHAPRDAHMALLKRILRYVKGTASLGLRLLPATLLKLTAYTNADRAGCPDTRRSTSGFAVFLGDSPVSWSSKRQATVSHSSAGDEYHGVANAVAECSWLRHLLSELHCNIQGATIAYCDNVSSAGSSSADKTHRARRSLYSRKGCSRVLQACRLHSSTTSETVSASANLQQQRLRGVLAD
jgi:hypothetical protein